MTDTMDTVLANPEEAYAVLYYEANAAIRDLLEAATEHADGSQKGWSDVFMLVRASEALGSITTVIVGTAGSASSDSGSAGWTLNAPGGLTSGQYGWAQRTTLA